MKSRTFLCVFVVALLVGCRPAPKEIQPSPSAVICSQVFDTKLDEALSQRLHGEDAIRWVRHNYPNSELDLPGGGYIYWDAQNRGYNARFDALPEKSFVSYKLSEYARPSIAEVIACLGKPAGYWVGQTPGPESSVSRFIMFYPDKDILVEHGSLSNRSLWSVDTLRMDGVVIRKTASIELLAQGIFSDEYAKLVAANVRPWPEKIEDLRFQ